LYLRGLLLREGGEEEKGEKAGGGKEREGRGEEVEGPPSLPFTFPLPDEEGFGLPKILAWLPLWIFVRVTTLPTRPTLPAVGLGGGHVSPLDLPLYNRINWPMVVFVHFARDADSSWQQPTGPIQ